MEYNKNSEHYVACVKKMDDFYKMPEEFQKKEPNYHQYNGQRTLVDWIICSPIWDLCLRHEELDFSTLRGSLYLEEFKKEKERHEKKKLTGILKRRFERIWRKAKHFFGPTVLLALTFSFIQGLLLMIVFEVICILLAATYKPLILY